MQILSLCVCACDVCVCTWCVCVHVLESKKEQYSVPNVLNGLRVREEGPFIHVQNTNRFV